ncbi:MAG: discoidin domain-containing protein, partial [Flavobacteriales bacterium]|nr:discoidin domain-containing protein [Flavobacteriales bacterium]
IEIGLSSVIKDAEIFYKTDAEFIKYEKPFEIMAASNIEAYVIINDKKSFVVKSAYKKIIGGRSIEILSEYDNQYNAGGDKALIDHLKGSANFRTGFWQGYYGKDIEVIVDLGKVQTIDRIAVGALQDIKSWIFYPSEIELLGSDNGTGFAPIAVMKNDFPDNEYGAFIKEFEFVPTTKVQYRYIKVKVKNYGVCPDWHLGNGGDTWLFLDEITVE